MKRLIKSSSDSTGNLLADSRVVAEVVVVVVEGVVVAGLLVVGGSLVELRCSPRKMELSESSSLLKLFEAVRLASVPPTPLKKFLI